MAGIPYTTSSAPSGENALNGGLNSTAGALELKDNESPDLQNVEFDKFGSVIKRNGYATVNTASYWGTAAFDGIWWYEYNNAGTPTRYLVGVSSGNMWKMDALDGAWDKITGALTITASNHCDFENFLNQVYVTNGVNPPFYWAGGTTAGAMSVPSGLTTAKYVKQFNNYLFLANVTVSATTYPSRIYWSNIKDTATWGGDQFIEISKDDGQEITGLKVLQDRLVIYKQRAIYNLFFTGDADIPFVLPGGGKSNSSVGCTVPFSIQEVENGHVFMAADGLYYYDGSNSYKLSYRIQKTFADNINNNVISNGVSCVYKKKNQYMLSLTSAGQTTHDRVIVWDYFNNAFSVYVGVKAASMTSVFVNGFEERVYFGDYSGFAYRLDTGTDDYPLNVQTAISAYYYTNWKTFQDLCDQKGIPHVYIYYQSSNSVLTFCYSYDFDSGDQYTQTMSLMGGVSLYGTARYGIDVYSSSGGKVVRRDLTGRGRSVRFKFANNVIGETFQIDGFGSFTHAETNV